MIYDIDVTYYLWNADGCYHKAKVAGNLNAHKKGIHGVSKEAWKWLMLLERFRWIIALSETQVMADIGCWEKRVELLKFLF